MRFSNVRYNGITVQRYLFLSPKEAMGILELRSLGYYKIQQGVLQQNLRIQQRMCVMSLIT